MDKEIIIPYLSMEIWEIKPELQRPRYDLEETKLKSSKIVLSATSY